VVASGTERGLAAALVAVVIWALVPVGTRFFVLRVDPYVFNVIRFAASGGAALPLFLHARPWRWRKPDRWLLAACAALAVPGYNVPVALAARTMPGGEIGILIATEPVMIIALTFLLQRRPIHWPIIAGSSIALFGVTLTSGLLNPTHKFEWVSSIQVLLGAFSWSCYTVLAVRLNQRYGAFGVTGAILVVGTVALLALSLPMIAAAMLPDRVTMLMLGAMGLSSSLLGFLAWNYAGARLPAERLGVFLYMIPVVSVFAGVEFLAESLTLQILIGGALTVLGVWIASRAGGLVTVAATE
jgi:drug/metabolite transporter (DMT)-like permease